MGNNHLALHSGMARVLVKDHGVPTPFLMIDESALDRALDLFHTYLPDLRLFYAAKANPASNVISYFVQNGLGVDVASAGEIEQVVRLGVSGGKMFLSTPIKTTATIASLFRNRIEFCAVDSTAEIERLANFRDNNRLEFAPQIFVRIRIESKGVEVDLNKKFGCSVVEALDVIKRALDLGFNVTGVSFHVGTRCTTVDNYYLGIESAMLVAKESARRFNLKIRTINIGGGFCDPIVANETGTDINKFYADVGEACKEALDSGFELFAEPGRCLVAAAGTLVSTVIGTNSRNERNWAYLDDGIYGCCSIKLYEKHRFEFRRIDLIRQVGPAQRTEDYGAWTLAGPTCDSLDIVAEDVALPQDLLPGDVLICPNMGAYSSATACNFNGFSLPDCYVVSCTKSNKGRLKVVLRTYNSVSDGKSVANW